MARAKSDRGSKNPVRFSSDPGKNEEMVGTRVVEYLQIPEKRALILTCIILFVEGEGLAGREEHGELRV